MIGGVTASGKSDLALAVAERVNGHVINADSVQLYKDLSILTARPTPSDEKRVPHKLYGVLEAHETSTAASWLGTAENAIRACQSLGKLPVVVGGTGLYLQALRDGLAPIPQIDPAVRSYVRGLKPHRLAVELCRLDPRTADRLPAGDMQRQMRALEVVLSTGRTQASWQLDERFRGGKPAKLTVTLVPERDVVRTRAHARMSDMIKLGAVAQVVDLCTRYDNPLGLPIAKTHGLAELVMVLRGEMTEAEAIDRTSIRVGQYVKRQETWFRHRMPEAINFVGFGSDRYVLERVLRILSG